MPLIFNIMVDAIVREWLCQVLCTEAARHDGCGAALQMPTAIFYVDNTLLASRDPKLLQEELVIIVGLSKRIRLRTNTTKTKVVICILGKGRTCRADSVYNYMQEGLVASSDMQTHSMDCDICGQSFQANTISNRLETMHDVCRSRVINRDLLVEREPVVYGAMPPASGRVFCTVSECAGSATTT